jgi:hypothetical protein
MKAAMDSLRAPDCDAMERILQLKALPFTYRSVTDCNIRA